MADAMLSRVLRWAQLGFAKLNGMKHGQPDLEQQTSASLAASSTGISTIMGRPRPGLGTGMSEAEEKRLSPDEKLFIFRSLTGIHELPGLGQERAARNVGIYPRVVRAEGIARRSYRAYQMVINLCLGAQIVVGAMVTALSTVTLFRHALTVFGTINTILAAVMTYLKASGLPDNFKQMADEWQQVREYIEQREREFCLGGGMMDVGEELRVIEDMYTGVKEGADGKKSRGVRGLVRGRGEEAVQRQTFTWKSEDDGREKGDYRGKDDEERLREEASQEKGKGKEREMAYAGEEKDKDASEETRETDYAAEGREKEIKEIKIEHKEKKEEIKVEKETERKKGDEGGPSSP